MNDTLWAVFFDYVAEEDEFDQEAYGNDVHLFYEREAALDDAERLRNSTSADFNVTVRPIDVPIGSVCYVWRSYYHDGGTAVKDTSDLHICSSSEWDELLARTAGGKSPDKVIPAWGWY